MTELILKNFNNHNIQVYGTNEEPLFKASDVGKILGIKNIRDTINTFETHEKVAVGNTYSDFCKGEFQNPNPFILMLTEQGLYRLLFISRKPIAKEFRKWVYEVIKSIRLTGKYELENKIKEIEENKTKEIIQLQKIENKKRIQMKEDILIQKFKEEPGLYIFGPLKENEEIYKYGETTQLEKRIQTHKKELTSGGNLIEFIPTPYHKELEKKFQVQIKDNRIKFQEQTEIIEGIDPNKMFEIAMNIKEKIHREHMYQEFELKKLDKQKEIEEGRNKTKIKIEEERNKTKIEITKIKYGSKKEGEKNDEKKEKLTLTSFRRRIFEYVESLKVKDLTSICKERNIIRYSGKSKSQIIDIIKNYIQNKLNLIPEKEIEFQIDVSQKWLNQLDLILDRYQKIEYIKTPSSIIENLDNQKTKVITDETEEIFKILDNTIKYEKGKKINRTELYEKVIKSNEFLKTRQEFYENIMPKYLRLKYSDKNIEYESKNLKENKQVFRGWVDFIFLE